MRGRPDLRFDFLQRVLVERLEKLAATALLRVSAGAIVSYEVFQGAEEKRAKAPFLPVCSRVGASRDEVGEKSLSQILRIFGSYSFAPQEEVERSPINPAKLRERVEGACRRNA